MEPAPFLAPRAHEAMRTGYLRTLETCIRRRGVFVAGFLPFAPLRFLLDPVARTRLLSQLPTPASSICISAPKPELVSKRPRGLGDRRNRFVRRFQSPTCPASSITSGYSTVPSTWPTAIPWRFIGTMDADVLVTLKLINRPTDLYVHELRRKLPREFLGSRPTLPADNVSQTLNFGLPAPIDIQAVRAQTGREPSGLPPTCSANSAWCPARWISASISSSIFL